MTAKKKPHGIANLLLGAGLMFFVLTMVEQDMSKSWNYVFLGVSLLLCSFLARKKL
jgi:hypothetical protein